MNTPLNMTATVFVALALALGSGCRRERAESGPGPEPKPVRVYVVEKQDIPVRIIASGAIEAVHKSDVAFMVAGRVIAVDAEDGALVKQGQSLARLDPADYEKGLAIAEAQFVEVEARHARLSRLHDAGSLTDTDFDKIDAALKQTGSALELARRQHGYTKLSAPFDGWVVKRSIAAGVVVAPGVPVFTVFSPGAVWANLGVSEAEVSKASVGQSVVVSVPAARVDAQRGTVESILPNADLLSRAFTVKVRLDNRDGSLRHGNVVVGHIFTGETRRAVTVPLQVVQKNPDGSLFVWLIDPVRQVSVRQIVEVGVLFATEVEITAGLKEGDRIILNVPHTLFEGERLTVAE